MRWLFVLMLIAGFNLFVSCQSEIPDMEPPVDYPFQIVDELIIVDGSPVTYKGVNALQTYGLVDQNLLSEWNVEITREFIGNLREQPIDGGPILASDDVWYHPLQKIVEQNRNHNRITILCPFGWVDDSGERTLLTGLNPTDQLFYDAYLNRMKEIAHHFSDQPDVWIEIWNEPYHWKNENGYSHNMWLKDMSEMVSNLRSVEGFDNIIVVPGNKQGQSENSVIQKGEQLLESNFNIIFDLHAYELWLIDHSQEEIEARLLALRNMGIPFLFGEVGVENSSGLMNVDYFLEAVKAHQVTTLGWVWNTNSSYSNALLSDDGLPNDRENLGWGSTFKTFLAQ